MTTSTQLHIRLSDAPMGMLGMHEAALLWTERRPHAWRQSQPAPDARHLALVQTEELAAACRMTRLVAGLSRAFVEESAGGHAVRVPVGEYHRLLRSLTAAWRDCRSQLASPVAAAGNDGLAAAAWRVGMLAGLADLTPSCVAVRTVTDVVRGMLVNAAEGLGLGSRVYGSGSARTLVVSGHYQVSRLLDLTVGANELRRCLSGNQAAAR